MIYDIKLDFPWKSMLVVNVHKLHDPAVSTYTEVVSHKTVRIVFIYAVLTDIEVKDCDMLNKYLQHPTSVNYYSRLMGILYHKMKDNSHT